MKVCKSCGEPLHAGERFCGNCGDPDPTWKGDSGIAALCCGLVGFAVGVIGAFWSFMGLGMLLQHVGAPPAYARQEFWISKGQSVAFLVELLVAIAVLVWLYRPRTLARWHPALRAGVLAVWFGFLGLTSVCNLFSIWNL